MFFDDRLATVLRHRATGEHAARTQFRQLLDLLGNRKYGRDESLVAAAWLRLGALGEQIPSADRARMIAEPGWRFRSPELAAHLAEDEPEVAAAALSRANLTEEDWEALIPRLPIRARGFLRLRRDLPEGATALLEQLGIHDRGLPQPQAEVPAADAGNDAAIPLTDRPEPEVDASPEPLEVTPDDVAPAPEHAEPFEPRAQQPAESGERNEIAALVERIAQFRREREPGSGHMDQHPRLPLEDLPQGAKRRLGAFAFTADASGRIDWADGAAASMVVGKRLLPRRRLGETAPLSAMARAFSRQQPVSGATVTLEGAPAIEGEWIVDAHPRFERSGGRFHGYAGRFRRVVAEDENERRNSEADRIRQLLHELRTPVNALQGFAEVIQQQLFGPAPNEYRALAASIAGDAARILAGFDELERLAKLESGMVQPHSGETDFTPLVESMVNQLQHVLSPRMASIEFEEEPARPLPVAIEEAEAEALAWRLLATVAGAAGAGEDLPLMMIGRDGKMELGCRLPAALMAEKDLFSAQVKPASGGLSAGLFGAGFSLRLARAEARAAGGELLHEEDMLRLTLPLLTATEHLPSQEQVQRSGADATRG